MDERRWDLASVADGLTVSRIVLAAAIGISVAGDRLDISAVLLVVAWLTDLLDGIAARAAAGPTRLGNWDFRVDVTMGVSILVGLVIVGRVPVWVVLSAVVLLGVWARIGGNPAPAMLFMAVVYAWYLLNLFVDKPALWWLPVAAIPVVLAIDWRRFSRTILPAFFSGMAKLGDTELARERSPVLDEWAENEEAG
ncbi:MAG TPA: CDP-alcohol phosphatidyltransferase family protein [Acidimicrobiia bacterium]|nr:CDP-alcohol phosphatidyltransferase family protein [Acidimicrobiia bacterium]